jgi:transposase
MGLLLRDDGWRIPDEVWAEMEPLLPPRREHPLGCHNPRVPDRDAMNAILFVLRTGCQWNALNATGICSCSSAYRRFREWSEAGVFLEFWRRGLIAYDTSKGIEWEWLAADGAMTKSPPRRPSVRTESHRQSQEGHETQPALRGGGRADRARGRRRQRQRL